MVTKWNHLRRLIELASSRATGGIIWGGSFTRYFVQVTLIYKRDIVKIYEQDRLYYFKAFSQVFDWSKFKVQFYVTNGLMNGLRRNDIRLRSDYCTFYALANL